MERKKIAVIGAVVAAFAAFIAWTVFTIPEPVVPTKEDAAKKREMEYSENTIREEVGGKPAWELTTSSSKMDVKTQTTTFKDAKGKYYLEDGSELTLTAPEGVYNGKTKNVKLKGGVTATTTDGKKLTSKQLEWISGKNRLVATGKAKVSQPGMTLSADRIEAWDEFRRFRATGHAHYVEDKKKKGAKAE